jgi:DNA repair exonuclease SbcCD ATPase subunit
MGKLITNERWTQMNQECSLENSCKGCKSTGICGSERKEAKKFAASVAGVFGLFSSTERRLINVSGELEELHKEVKEKESAWATERKAADEKLMETLARADSSEKEMVIQKGLVDSLNKKVEKLYDEIDKRDAQLRQASDLNTKRKTEADELKKELKKLEKSQGMSATVIVRKQKQIKKLEGEVSELKNELTTLEEQLESGIFGDTVSVLESREVLKKLAESDEDGD